MLVGFRVLTGLIVAGVGLALLGPTQAVADDPPTAPTVCAPEQEADPAAADCHTARIESASARYLGIPLSEREKQPATHYLKTPDGFKPSEQTSPTPATYARWATEAAAVTCRIAAKEGGELCVDLATCVGETGLREFCEALAGGTLTDGIARSDAKLPEKLRMAKTTARAADAAGKALKNHDAPATRVAAAIAETAAAAAAREMNWID